MANHRVSGQLVPDAVAGHVALELANTRAGWGGSAPREYLVSYDALAVWAGDVGLLTGPELRRVTMAWVLVLLSIRLGARFVFRAIFRRAGSHSRHTGAA